MRRGILALLAAALTAVALAVPAVAGQEFTTFQVTLSPAGDTDGTGSALLETDVECVSVSSFQGHARRELRRMGKNPGGYLLELYNEEHPGWPGAVRGQLEGVS